MKKHAQKYQFTLVSIFCYVMLSFILNNWNPFTWCQDERMILVIWIFIFYCLALATEKFKNFPHGQD
jgi:predicted Na+-dependent transporter